MISAGFDADTKRHAGETDNELQGRNTCESFLTVDRPQGCEQYK